MRVRTQLVVAFLALAVVPLAAIVFFSYWTSQEAIRQAVSAESAEMTKEMGERLDSVRRGIEKRLKRVASLPVRSLMDERQVTGEAGKVYTDLMSQMGDLTEVVDWFEFTPEDTEVVEGQPHSEPFLIYPSVTLTRALERLNRHALSLEEAGVSQEYLESLVQEAIKSRERLEEAELEAVEARGAEIERLLGAELVSPVRRGEDVVGHIKAMVPASQLLRQVLALTPRKGGEVPFARDAEGDIYVQYPEDKIVLAEVGILVDSDGDGEPAEYSADWIVAQSVDAESGLVLGIARPIALSIREIRRTAFNNFAYGLVLIVLAMIGILWLSTRMTTNLSLLTKGAEKLANGDLDVQVPLKSGDEFGQLATTFNRMAGQIREHQVRLVDEERRRKEQEMQQRLLEVENERRGRELEEARQLQLSLLPAEVPELSDLEIAAFMRTAAEVGGDYYDFFRAEGGGLTAVIGDAAGHGLRAGTMVSVVKGLLTASATEAGLSKLLHDATRALKQMNLGRMNMALTLVRYQDRRISISAAGMPPALISRSRTGRVEEVVLPGTPLGGFANATYQEWDSTLEAGDTVLLMTDGFPELLNDSGEPLGYERVRSIFEASVSDRPGAMIKNLARQAEKWSGDRSPADDITFLVLQVKENA